MKVKTEKLPKSTIKINVIVENADVKNMYDTVVLELVQETTLEGFRKGNAPKEMVIDKIGKPEIHGKVVNRILQKYYPQALKENLVLPVSNPQVEIKEFSLDKDFEFDAIVATKPDVKIGDYSKDLKKAYEELKTQKSKENEEKIKSGEKIEEGHIHMSPTQVISILLEKSEVEVPDLLVTEETDRMISRLVNQAQTVGLSLEQYLKAQNKTADDLRVDYDKISERNLKTEFVLAQLVKDLKVEIEDKEIENAFVAAGYPPSEVQSHMQDSMERSYIKSVLQKNKLITNLIEELEGVKHEHN